MLRKIKQVAMKYHLKSKTLTILALFFHLQNYKLSLQSQTHLPYITHSSTLLTRTEKAAQEVRGN